jgi:hypothetical protein
LDGGHPSLSEGHNGGYACERYAVVVVVVVVVVFLVRRRSRRRCCYLLLLLDEPTFSKR